MAIGMRKCHYDIKCDINKGNGVNFMVAILNSVYPFFIGYDTVYMKKRERIKSKCFFTYTVYTLWPFSLSTLELCILCYI